MPDNLSPALSHYFSGMLGAGRASTPTEHVAHGADCVNAADLAGLRRRLGQIRQKAATVHAGRLRQRLEVLAAFVEETGAGIDSAALREAAFALCYFMRGHDLIPDSIPEIGLLDDALLVETAVNRNLHELRSHWAAQGRTWPGSF